MKVTITKSEVKGRVVVPTSKSMTIRALMCAAVSRGNTEIINPLVSDDTNIAAEVLGKVGISIQKDSDVWRVTGGTLKAPVTPDLYCGESASTLRFMMAICSLIPGEHQLVGGPSLSKRPVRSLVEALMKLGVKCDMAGKTTPPVTVTGGTLKGGLTELPGNISSQFISALLLIAPFAEKEVSIRLTTSLTSKPYVLMTLSCLRRFGIGVRTEMDKFIVRRQRYKATRFKVDGDWSSASYFLALGAFSEGITVDNLSTASLQGDRALLDFLRLMGASVKLAGNSVIVSQAPLKAIHADLSDCIDLLPTVAVLAAMAAGISEFTGIERARIKESNRVAAVKEGLSRLGISVMEDRDRLTIVGMKKVAKAGMGGEEEEEEESGKEKAAVIPKGEREPVVIDSHNDHRIAMAFGVLGAVLGGVTIDGAECVNKTYPGFWDALKSVGGKLKIDAQ
ncbi:MAG: 3-phosphoshikimate 1-carboxyvinyltransferase [Chloroflexota bacterium]